MANQITPSQKAQIIDNLRRNNPGLFDNTSDEDLWAAYDLWCTSEDHPDEAKIIEWVGLG